MTKIPNDVIGRMLILEEAVQFNFLADRSQLRLDVYEAAIAAKEKVKYVKISDNPVFDTVEILDNLVFVDLDIDGNPVGIEVSA